MYICVCIHVYTSRFVPCSRGLLCYLLAGWQAAAPLALHNTWQPAPLASNIGGGGGAHTGGGTSPERHFAAPNTGGGGGAANLGGGVGGAAHTRGGGVDTAGGAAGGANTGGGTPVGDTAGGERRWWDASSPAEDGKLKQNSVFKISKAYSPLGHHQRWTPRAR